MSTKSQYITYEIKDMSLVEWGRQEIKLAEAKTPSLLALREEYGANKPLVSARNAGCLQMHDKVARLHLEKIGVELEILREDQAKFIEVTVEGQFKSEQYRY